MMGGMEITSPSYHYYTVRVYTPACFGYVFDVSSLIAYVGRGGGNSLITPNLGDV